MYESGGNTLARIAIRGGVFWGQYITIQLMGFGRLVTFRAIYQALVNRERKGLLVALFYFMLRVFVV